MKKTVIRALAFTALGTLCMVCAAQEKVMLVHKSVKGQVTHCNLELTFRISSKSLNLVETTIETETVKSISPTGDITSQSTTGVATRTANGEKRPDDPANNHVTTSVVHSDGALVSCSDDMKDPSELSMFNCRYCMANIVFGTKPVGVGDSWTVSIKPAQMPKVVSGTAVYKVISSGLKQGVDCFEIQGAFHETTGPNPVSASSTVWIDKKTGDAVSADLTINNLTIADVGSVVAQIKTSKIIGADAAEVKPR